MFKKPDLSTRIKTYLKNYKEYNSYTDLDTFLNLIEVSIQHNSAANDSEDFVKVQDLLNQRKKIVKEIQDKINFIEEIYETIIITIIKKKIDEIQPELESYQNINAKFNNDLLFYKKNLNTFNLNEEQIKDHIDKINIIILTIADYNLLISKYKKLMSLINSSLKKLVA